MGRSDGRVDCQSTRARSGRFPDVTQEQSTDSRLHRQALRKQKRAGGITGAFGLLLRFT
ncbi:hypothetical protein BN1263180114 [Stenotrophomonas maltophilia]|nr:hypothetical protein BN1263180114 [Stenotrophomonas maltophilia]